jgi:integrase
MLPSQVLLLHNCTPPNYTALQTLQLRVFVVMAWAGMFRFSELFTADKNQFDVSKDLIAFRFGSKTSKRRGAQHRVLLTPDMDEFLPLFAPLKALLAEVTSGRIFAGCPALKSNSSFNAFLKGELGQDTISSHGFRSGGVAIGLAAQVDSNLIRLLGRWSPDSTSWDAHYGQKARPFVPVVRLQLEQLTNHQFEDLIPSIRRFLRA